LSCSAPMMLTYLTGLVFFFALVIVSLVFLDRLACERLGPLSLQQLTIHQIFFHL